MCAIDHLVQRGLADGLEDRVSVLYVSPLKALSNDIEKNLQAQTDRHFRQIDQAFPKMRGDEPSDAYAKFREMMEELN